MQRIMVAEKYRAFIERKARDNKILAMEKERKENPNNEEEQFCSIPNKTVNIIDTQKELSKIAKVGKDTYWKGKKILVVLSYK